MCLRIVPFSEVATEVEKIKSSYDTSHPSSRSQRFCTAQHSASEITPVVPEHAAFTHEIPNWAPYDYTLWAPLIARSQGLGKREHYVGKIPGFMWQDLMQVHGSWVTHGEIRRAVLDDVVEIWRATGAGREMDSWFKSGGGDGQAEEGGKGEGDGKGRGKEWFIRLAQMSPKDSPLGGKLPAKSMEDIIVRICSSMRAYWCLQREMEDARAQGRDVDIKVVVNRWDEDMDAAREFRVFVAPPLARRQGKKIEDVVLEKDMKITAISQYKWPAPFVFPYEGLDLEETKEVVSTGADAVLMDILEFMDNEMEREIRDMLVRYGFSFDIIVKEGGDVQLVEVNPFGALSGCGACLFNWVLDGKMMYGLEEAEFSVTMADT